MLFISANAAEDAGGKLKLLADAQRSFCRSIELCDDYLRGYYGLKLVSSLPLIMSLTFRLTK